tara:strand:- start:996 stop:1124 length:129 start_codon:yes stop_codon:yes gene_type:complete
MANQQLTRQNGLLFEAMHIRLHTVPFRVNIISSEQDQMGNAE